jgi:hypothetical protein
MNARKLASNERGTEVPTFERFYLSNPSGNPKSHSKELITIQQLKFVGNPLRKYNRIPHPSFELLKRRMS